MRLIHECLGLPASPPASSEESEAESESPAPPLSIPMEQPVFNPQLIRIDERTMQLHFTPLYFGKGRRARL